jgi:hypothetical protein
MRDVPSFAIITCCGTPGTWREYRRQLAATLVHAHMRQTLAHEQPGEVSAAGDMNLVTGGAALDTILCTLVAGPRRPVVVDFTFGR